MAQKILFYFNWQLKPVHFGIVIEKLQDLLNKNEQAEIYFLTCEGSLAPCYQNKFADVALCNICNFNNWVGLKKFQGKVKKISLSAFKQNISLEKELQNYNSIEDIKKLIYKDVFIGYGALSSYISFTRNLEPIINNDFKEYFDKLLLSQVNMADALLEIIEQKEINEVYFFNGRTADTRPVYDICKANKIPFVSLEMIKKSDDEFYINDFVNCLPHDIYFHHERNLKTWDESTDSEDEKWSLGSSFFEKRRNGMLAREKVVFTKNQQSGLLPDYWDNKKKNITIFISSEDEFASIGDIFEKLALFKTQEEGLIAILEKFENQIDYHFYVRLHPNLADVKYSYHTRLLDLQDKYQNVSIIGANSNISTYALIDHSAIIIAFGSTTGIEACYSEKPVILVAGSFYYHLDVAYKPKTKEAFFELLTQDLLPKPKIEAIKYGYYMMNYQKYTRKNINNPQPIYFFGKKIGLGHDHLKVLGSSLLFRIIEKILYFFANLFKRKKLTIPSKGI